MGIFSRGSSPQTKTDILAQYAPTIMGENISSLYNYVLPRITRNEAMSVPSVARCRNLIAGVIADLDLNLYRKSTGEELGNPVWVEQPSINQPRETTIAWTVDSLIMYGEAYWEVTEVYAEDGRPSRFEWIPNVKVTFDTDLYGTKVQTYYVDGVARPQWGVGSIITFQGFDEGELTFPPTYKYQPGTDKYETRAEKKLRTPSWCDRILYKSIDSFNKKANLIKLNQN
jgi:hypothetical protein